MSVKRTIDCAKTGQNDSKTGLLGGSTPWLGSPRSEVLLPATKPPNTGGQVDVILILSDKRQVQEALATVLNYTFGHVDIRAVTNLAEVKAQLECTVPELAIIDATMKQGLAAATLLSQVGLGVEVIAFGLDAAADPIAAWSQAGISPCLTSTLSLKELAVTQNTRAECDAPEAAHSGEPPQSADFGPRGANGSPTILTAREEEVARLIVSGESNKDIARSLNISVATVKSHVHNLLAKLGLERRGKLRRWHDGRQIAQAVPLPPHAAVPSGIPVECPILPR